MKNVAIFTSFYSIDRAYSICNVVEDQLRMLLGAGYTPTLVVTTGFKADGVFADPRVILKTITDVSRSNDGDIPQDYETQVARCTEELRVALMGIDVCITHDIIYGPAEILFNLAARRIAAMRPELRWLHWIHSATGPQIRCSNEQVRSVIQTKFPNSFVCYPNEGDRPRVARNFGYEEDEVKVVHHPIDTPSYLGFHPLTTKLWEERGLTNADVICTYPIRLDRGKQVEHVIKILAGVKRTGRSVRGIIVDFHSTGGDKIVYRNTLKALTKSLDVEQEIFFTSDLVEETSYSVPREVVRDLMLVSNLFVMPSASETYSLITQEAALCKNFLILNKDFPPLRSVWGDTPLYKQFSGGIGLDGLNGEIITTYSNEQAWYYDLACAVNYYLENNPVLKMQKLVRQTRNPMYVFKQQIEPLLYA